MDETYISDLITIAITLRIIVCHDGVVEVVYTLFSRRLCFCSITVFNLTFVKSTDEVK